MAGYIPGEQPRDGTYIKLNTNENPYPPSPRVFEAIRAALTGNHLRKYPDPLGTAFRETAGKILGVNPEAILIGNGSDDVLTIVTRSFVSDSGVIVSLTPSYLLYRTLAEIQGAGFKEVPFTENWELPAPWPLSKASLTFVSNPNSPSGTTAAISEFRGLLEELSGPLVIDEAYVDFADQSALPLAQCPNVIVTRSLSKSYSLAGIRFGFAVADPPLIREMVKVKDSYNCDVLSLAAATAALEDQEYMKTNRSRILATRTVLERSLVNLGFAVAPSQANFVWCRRHKQPAKPLYEELKRRMILVRYMNYPGYGDGLRITVGTDAEIARLIEELKQLV
jgi:histidinol-phosphate aminotransferase